MLLHVIFTFYVSVASANLDLFRGFFSDLTLRDESEEVHSRHPRQKPKKQEFIEFAPSCEQMGRTSLTPFVVILLYKNSGRFLGMGSIIDKKTVLTAAAVVDPVKTPDLILVLAGRLSPWWGKDSQVKRGSEIYQNDVGLALVVLEEELRYNKNILPIDLPENPSPDFLGDYDSQWAVFGIPRSSWDMPGDPTSKANIYLTRAEDVILDKKTIDQCVSVYPDVDYNETHMACTYANGSFSWGCVGSPTVAIDKDDKIIQIAVVTKAASTETDDCHVHVKVAYFEQWIRSQSLFGFKNN